MPDRPPSLQDYLADQLGEMELEEDERRLARHICSFVDRTGYLGARERASEDDDKDTFRTVTLDEIAAVYDRLTTAEDVIHSWAMPSFGVKLDAVPGRLNETWIEILREGTFYGQCSELCGKDHAFMPIAIRVVKQEQYDAWLAAAKSDLPGAYKALSASIEAEHKVASAAN